MGNSFYSPFFYYVIHIYNNVRAHVRTLYYISFILIIKNISIKNGYEEIKFQFKIKYQINYKL